MNEYSVQNKKAWEYNAYEFWVKTSGTPAERARQDRDDPVRMLKKYAQYFDRYEGDGFMDKMYSLLKMGGKMICSDFHPFTKIKDILEFEQPSRGYFDTEVFEGEMAHARFFEDRIRRQMPKCSYRKYTVSEIINSIINSGFCLRKFEEHPAWTNDKIPGEFTAIAVK